MYLILTKVISLDAAAALICNEGCRTVLVQSRARANVPTDRAITKNWSISFLLNTFVGSHTNVSKSSDLRVSSSPRQKTTKQQ